MLTAAGDLWTFPAQYRCVTTNGVVAADGQLVMVAGVALQAKLRYPGLPAKLARWVEQYGNRPFICKDEGLITFPTKDDWRQPSALSLIVHSAKLLVAIADKYGLHSIVMPPPGCGHGGLSWSEVHEAISPIFDDRFVVIRR